jgi:hypothetical protein
MSSGRNAPRILLVENDKRVRESYEVLLHYWGYCPVLAIGEGRSLIRNATMKAKNSHCILALIDLRLMDDFDEEDSSGLRLTREIGPIRSIILTGYPTQRILREMLEHYKDIPLLSKSDSPEKIKITIDTEVGKVCAVKRGLEISPENIFAQIRHTPFGSLIRKYPDQVPDILAQLLPSASKLKIERLDSSFYSTQVSGVPRPKSIVLRVFEEDFEPVVIKLARARKIEVEVDRYEKYIARKIGGNFIAKLERHAELWDIGGVLYSYIGDFDVVTFSRYYEDHPIDDIRDCLRLFFTVSWEKHYERAQSLNHVSLFELYSEVWGDWYAKSVKEFSTDGLWENEGMIKWLELPNPIEWFKHYIAENPEQDVSIVESTQKAVTHGDLHGDNLLIDSRKNAWVIDYERSGEGHVLQDFIELESDIINRLEAHPESISSYYQMCLVVARQTEIKPLEESEMNSQDPSVRKALQTISVLRSLAQQCTGIQDARQYLLGLLFNTIFRATINSDKHHDRQRRSLRLAGIFCHRLEHWNESWPPEEWKPILQS